MNVSRRRDAFPFSISYGDWGAINTEAHKLRGKRFGEWYFMNFTPESMFTRMIERLRAHSLPGKLILRGPRFELLLPFRVVRGFRG
jgi:hypothetical protein